MALCGAGPTPDSTDIGNVAVSPAPGIADTSVPTATQIAPSAAPLTASQPTSVINQSAIRTQNLTTESYDQIIKYSPSVQNVSGTGAGLQQNFQETIRGFRYTQFNSIVDGLVLPGGISSFAPQTGAYFMSHDIASVSVDRGPGTASTIGNATFGGTVSMRTIDPSDTMHVNPYATYGSWNTVLGGIQLDTGRIEELGGTKAVIDYSNSASDSYLTYSGDRRQNLFTKIEVPIGDNTLVTFLANIDNARTQTPYGALVQNLSAFGPNFSLNRNPASQSNAAYNSDNYNTDYEYIDIKSDLGDGWKIQNTAYTSGYYHHGLSGADTGDVLPNGTVPAGGTTNLIGSFYVGGVRQTLNGDVPGIITHTDFRDVGDVFRVTKDTDFGQARAGIWFDSVAASALKENVDITQGDIPYQTRLSKPAATTNYQSTLNTVQPYVEFATTLLPGLTITPGVRYTAAIRSFKAVYDSKLSGPADFNETFSAFTPAIDVHYEPVKGWVFYGQAAQGFLTPPLNVLSSATVVTGNVKPQTTTNWQIGTTYQSGALSLGLDGYYILFQNYIGAQSSTQGTVYANEGGAVFKGLEAEGTYKVTEEFALYANGSLNSANYNATGFPVALSPRSTAAGGPLYQSGNFKASLLGKYIGPQYTLDGSGGPSSRPMFPIKGFSSVDLALEDTFTVQGDRKDLPITGKLNFYNLLNNHSLIGIQGTTASNLPLFFANPGFAVFASLSMVY